MAGPWTVSRTTTASSAKANGSRYRPLASCSWSACTRPRGRRPCPGARAADEQPVERRILDAHDVRAAGQRLARRQQRVEVGIQADASRRRRRPERRRSRAARHELAGGSADVVDRRARRRVQSATTASAAASGRVRRSCVGLSSSIVSGFFGAAQVPAVVLACPAGALSAFCGGRRGCRRPTGSAAASNSGEAGGMGPVGRRCQPANASVDELRRGRSPRARPVRTAGSRELGWLGRRFSRTAVSVEPGSERAGCPASPPSSAASWRGRPDAASRSPAR